MAEPGRQDEIMEVDAFLAEAKVLRGAVPEWVVSDWKNHLAATWVVEDAHGIARGQLRFMCRRAKDIYPSISLIFRGHPIWRVEIEDPPLAHRNPQWAADLGLPPIVRGSHEHAWPDNRDYVSQTAGGGWDIPCRRVLQPQIQRLPQAFAWFASQVSLSLESMHRGFDVPPQREMF